MNKVMISVSAVAILIAATMLPANAQTTLVDVSLGFALDETFDEGDGGWSASPVPPPTRPAPTVTWEWGAPTSGPGVAASGANVWATHLGGNYLANECAGLMTPPIDLTSATSASVSFAEWHHFEQSTATSTGWDAGLIMVTADGGDTFSVVVPAGGYTTNSLSFAARTCFDGAATSLRALTGPFGTTPPAPAYATRTADLSAFAGQTVQVVLAFASDGSGHRAGWYVDDVAVTVDGVTTVEDFEASNGGFNAVATKVPPPQPLGWEWGVPSNGGPASDDAMWGTNIDGEYGVSECNWVESPAFTLGDVPPEAAGPVRATLSWSQWFKSSSSSGAGVVQIGVAGNYTNVAPKVGYPANPSSTVLDACLHHKETGGAFSGFLSSDGSMTEYEADVTEYLGQEITVRFLFASTTSTATYEGWYVDDVAVETSIFAEAPDVEGIVQELPVPGLGGSDAPGWTQGGPVSTWAYGVTTANPEGQTVYKTNLAGSHDANECSYIESPAIPGALFAGSPTLRFEHWHRIAGTSVNVPWSAGVVLISADGGATWQHLAMGDYTRPVRTTTYNEVYDDCLGGFGADAAGNAYGGAVTDFRWSEADLSAYADATAVKIRFAYGSDGTFAYEGWAIRAVELGGVKLL